jgi:glutamate synthase (ferredoxin)
MELVEPLNEQLSEEDLGNIKRMLESHLKYTGSTKAKEILDNWEKEQRYFVRVLPTDYRRVLENRAEMEERARQLSERQTAPSK